MTEQIPLGPEIPRGTREYAWVASIVDAAERRSGVLSRWNRRLYEEPNNLNLASARDDGPMTVSRRNILGPILSAYDAQRPLTDLEKVLARRSAVIVVHETEHHLCELGDAAAPDAIPYPSPEEVALAEGLADTRAFRSADAIIQDIGMDLAVPGVRHAQVAVTYPGYNAGVNGVVHGLHTISGLPPDEVRVAIERTPRLQRYNTMADLVIDARLDGLMPPDHRSQIRAKLARPLRHELAALSRYEAPDGDPQKLDGLGREFSARAIRAVGRELDWVEAHYRRYGDQPPRMALSLEDKLRLERVESYYGRPTAELEAAYLQQFLNTGGPGSGAAGGGTAAGASSAAAAAPYLTNPSMHSGRSPWRDGPTRS